MEIGSTDSSTGSGKHGFYYGWVILVLICLSPLIVALAVPRKYW